jgi:hypothetical protein
MDNTNCVALPYVALKVTFIYLLKMTVTLNLKIIMKSNVKYRRTPLKEQKGLIIIDRSLLPRTKLNLPGILYKL